MDTYRAGLVGLVNRARAIHPSLVLDEETRVPDAVADAAPYTCVDFRFAATILAKRDADPYLLVRAVVYCILDTSWGWFA